MKSNPIDDLRRARPDLFEGPEYWKSELSDIARAASAARKGKASVIGRSAGGREIIALEYGRFEPQHPTATISSAMGSDRPQSFYDPALRTRPAIILIGLIHGGETEGIASSLNLINLLETGKDLRGREQPGVLDLLGKVRIVIVPCLNPDGRATAGIRHLNNCEVDHIFLVQQGIMRDGTPFKGRQVKEVQPIPKGFLRFMGGYYNADGVNLQHDDFFGPKVCPENAAARDLFRREIPDAFLTFHAHGGPVGLTTPDAFISPGYQRKQSEAAFHILSRLTQAGHGVCLPDDCAGPPWSFYFQTWLHHMSGALPMLCELPHGMRGQAYPLERILDAGLTVLHGWLDFGLRFGFRPRGLDYYGTPVTATGDRPAKSSKRGRKR